MKEESTRTISNITYERFSWLIADWINEINLKPVSELTSPAAAQGVTFYNAVNVTENHEHFVVGHHMHVNV